jgi:hypothetical protein
MMDRYLDPHQARRHVPTQYESLLGDAIERAYAAGTHDLAGLVAYLNRTGPGPQEGETWTEDVYKAQIARMAEE